MDERNRFRYRINVKLRRQGQAAFPNNYAEMKSEDYDDDEDFCMAVASEMLEQLKADREYLIEKHSGDEEGE